MSNTGTATTVTKGAGANKWTISKADKALITGAVASVVEADHSVTTAKGVLVWRQANAVRIAEDLGAFGEGRLYPRRKDYATLILTSESRMSGLGTLAKAIRLGLAEGDPNTSVLSSNAGVKAVKEAKTLPAMIRAAKAAAKAKDEARKAGTAAREGRPNDGTDAQETPETPEGPDTRNGVTRVEDAVKALADTLAQVNKGTDPLTGEQWSHIRAMILRTVKREDTLAAKAAAAKAGESLAAVAEGA